MYTIDIMTVILKTINCVVIIALSHSSRVDALLMRQLKIDWFKIIALKLQVVSHNTTCLIIADSTLSKSIRHF